MDSNTTSYTKTFSIDLKRANYHRLQKQKKTKRFIIVCLFWILIILYMFLPFSKVNLKVNGNVYYSKEDLVKLGHVNESYLRWLYDENKTIKVLESYDYIEKVTVSKGLLYTKMEVKEIYPIAIKGDKYLLNNGNVVEKKDYPLNDKIEHIASYDIDEEDLKDFSYKYSRVKLDIRNKIYKVEMIKNSNGYRFVKLYFNDDNTYFVIKTDLIYLDTKFNSNKYDKIMEEVSKNNVKYNSDNPIYIAYHLPNEEEFKIVEGFEGE